MIRIMVDSAADCGKAAYDLFVPLRVCFGGREFHDGLDLTANRFYTLLTDSGEFPKTSQPSPEDFLAQFQKAVDAGDEVIYFALSSALSGTYQSARIARQILDYDKIHIVDTAAVSHMIPVLAEQAARRIRQGWNAEAIMEESQTLKSRIRVYAGVDTLEYLYRGGRLSKASAAVGELAGIKPIVTLSREGTVQACGKTIGVPRAIKWIRDKVARSEIDPDFPVYTLYTQGHAHVEKLEAGLTEAGIPVRGRRQVGPTIGSHVGPNVYGVLFVEK